MHAWRTRVTAEPARWPRWSSLGVALVVILATCANGWAAPRHAACAADGDDDGAIEQEQDDENEDADPIEAPPIVTRTVIAPPLRRVLAAAYRAAGLDGNPARGWTRRARLAGLVPWVSVRTGRNTSWAEDNASSIDHGTAMEARVTWRLDRLVFDGHELQVASIDAARRRERRRLASSVIRWYFTFLRNAASATARPRWTALADEAAAELDALTDAWFSDEVSRLRRTASEPRTL